MSKTTRTENQDGRSDLDLTESMLNISYVAWPDFTFQYNFEVEIDG